MTAAELYNTFKPTALATLHYLPRTSEILFHSFHWRIDGIGSLRLLDRCFGALAESRLVEFGDEGKNLSLSLDEAANVPVRTTPKTEQAAIISGCKANDLSVTVATHAANFRATQSDADAETSGNKHTTWLPFNLRR